MCGQRSNAASAEFNHSSKVTGSLDSGRLKPGKRDLGEGGERLYVSRCSLDADAILYGRVISATTTKGPDASELSVVFDRGDCTGHMRKQLALHLIGLVGPPDQSRKMHGEIPVEVAGGVQQVGGSRNGQDAVSELGGMDEELNPAALRIPFSGNRGQYPKGETRAGGGLDAVRGSPARAAAWSWVRLTTAPDHGDRPTVDEPLECLTVSENLDDPTLDLRPAKPKFRNARSCGPDLERSRALLHAMARSIRSAPDDLQRPASATSPSCVARSTACLPCRWPEQSFPSQRKPPTAYREPRGLCHW